jgi:hypothetical protein
MAEHLSLFKIGGAGGEFQEGLWWKTPLHLTFK